MNHLPDHDMNPPEQPDIEQFLEDTYTKELGEKFVNQSEYQRDSFWIEYVFNRHELCTQILIIREGMAPNRLGELLKEYCTEANWTEFYDWYYVNILDERD